MGKAAAVYQLKITLNNIKPPIWRRVEVKDCALWKLSAVIQTCFGWEGYHLWVFEIGGEQFGEDTGGDMEVHSARGVKLSQVIEGGVRTFTYVYDFGDDWKHQVKVEKTLQADPKVKYPRCVAGERAGPPEDCGGSWGYADLVEALKGPKTDRQEELLEWLGDEFDPEAFDLKAVNKELTGSR